MFNDFDGAQFLEPSITIQQVQQVAVERHAAYYQIARTTQGVIMSGITINQLPSEVTLFRGQGCGASNNGDVYELFYAEKAQIPNILAPAGEMALYALWQQERH
jgi:hypothetical protein